MISSPYAVGYEGPVPGYYAPSTPVAVSTPPAYELIPHRVFVGGFPSTTTENELRAHFEKHCRIREAKVIRSADTSGSGKGYGFITLDSEEEAEAVRSLAAEKLEFKGRRLNLGPALRRMTAHRYSTEYAVATPNGQLLSSSALGYTYSFPPHTPYVMLSSPMPQHGFVYGPPSTPTSVGPPQPLFPQTPTHTQPLHDGGCCSDAQSVASSGSVQMQPMPVPASPATVSQPVYNHSYYLQPIQPSTPVTPSAPQPLRNVASPAVYGYQQGYYAPATDMQPQYAQYPMQAGNYAYYYAPPYAYGEVVPMEQSAGGQHMEAALQPQQQQQAMVPATQQHDKACETPRFTGRRSNAMRNGECDDSSEYEDAAERRRRPAEDACTPSSSNSTVVVTRLEPRPRGRDGSYVRASTPRHAAHQLRFMRTPPSDTRSLPNTPPEGSSSLDNHTPVRKSVLQSRLRTPPRKSVASLGRQFQNMTVNAPETAFDRKMNAVLQTSPPCSPVDM